MSFKSLLDHFWVNIDPFDEYGQFCDRGYSYRSVAFFQNEEEKKMITQSIKELEIKFNKKIVTYVKKFEQFFIGEEIHQDYYKIKFVNYLRYKKACGRERILNRIWN